MDTAITPILSGSLQYDESVINIFRSGVIFKTWRIRRYVILGKEVVGLDTGFICSCRWHGGFYGGYGLGHIGNVLS